MSSSISAISRTCDSIQDRRDGRAGRNDIGGIEAEHVRGRVARVHTDRLGARDDLAYNETRDVAQVAALSRSVFWLVLPSLVLFLLLPAMLARGFNFYLSLVASMGATSVVYLGAISLGPHLGLRF